MEKTVIRETFLRARRQLGAATVAELSFRIQQRVIRSEHFCSAQFLALYSPVNNEVQTALLRSAAHRSGKCICFPRVTGDCLRFVAISECEELRVGYYGVLEPAGDNIIDPGQLDAVVVPGVCFSRSGYRLGYGKGYYDRALAEMRNRTVTIGLAFDCQLTDDLPIEEHDVCLDCLMTESQLISCHKVVAGST